MSIHRFERLPFFYARTAGILSLIILALAIFGMMYIPTVLIIPDDANATARNILENTWLYYLGILIELIIFLIEIGIVASLYMLLRPVSRVLSLIATFSRLLMVAIQGMNLIQFAMPSILLSGDGYLSVFSTEQLNALSLMFLNSHAFGAHIWTSSFAIHCFFLGYLIFRSGYFPKLLGHLMIFAALGYLLSSIGNILFPEYSDTYAILVSTTAFLGEIPFFILLIIKGVDLEGWSKKITANKASL